MKKTNVREQLRITTICLEVIQKRCTALEEENEKLKAEIERLKDGRDTDPA